MGYVSLISKDIDSESLLGFGQDSNSQPPAPKVDASSHWGCLFNIYIFIYYMTVEDNRYYPTAIKIVLARLWDNTFIRVIT